MIQYPPTRRELSCTYLDEVEDTIIAARRGLFQVRGKFVLDRSGHPKRLTDVHSIEPVDLTPIEVLELEAKGCWFVADPALIVEPGLDRETRQFFSAHVERPSRVLRASAPDGTTHAQS